ncbi:hypothetical protein [Arthrobacter roseus]|uniref:hypothetical protein n=1 Tax=Arthrobacter roseus TaxID=136274 RepID=UPI0019632A6B|nr:hypothetical protein [Arthrobacter roseus]MBM7849018.1 ATP synthase protein I [Arthrobacter roseus]
MTPPATDGFRAAGYVDGVSGPTQSPWLRILGTCLQFTAAALVTMTAIAMVSGGVAGAVSALYGAGIVVLFFGISLLIGHYAGRNNPSGAIGLFMAAYVLKVVGFAVVLFLLGTPDWLDRTWFFVAAVVVVIVWQTAEVFAFSKTRNLLYGPVTGPVAGEEKR